MYWSPPDKLNTEKVIKHVLSRTINHIIMASRSIKGGHVVFLGGHRGQISKYLVVLVAEMHRKWRWLPRSDKGSVVTLSNNFSC